MAYTDFPNGITSFGIPTFGPGAIPPFTGYYCWVNETLGADSFDGTATTPFATLGRALSFIAAQPGSASLENVVFLTGTVHLSAPLLWNLNNTHLIGLTAPSQNDRARISVKAGLTQTQVTAFHPLVNVTGNGCIFANIGTFYGFDGILTPPVASVCWIENGGRNNYANCQFLGGGDALMAALAGMRSITISTGENLFTDCTFGLDTVTRATNANATMEFLTAAPRNKFIRPIFNALVTDASDVHVKVAAGGADRSTYMFEPIFANAVDSTGTTMNAAVVWDAAAGGNLIIVNGVSVGATAVATTGPVYSNMPQANAAGIVGVKLT